MRLHNPLSPEPIGQAGNERQENEQDKEERESRRREGSLLAEESPREKQLERSRAAQTQNRSKAQAGAEPLRGSEAGLGDQAGYHHRWNQTILEGAQGDRSEELTCRAEESGDETDSCNGQAGGGKPTARRCG